MNITEAAVASTRASSLPFIRRASLKNRRCDIESSLWIRSVTAITLCQVIARLQHDCGASLGFDDDLVERRTYCGHSAHHLGMPATTRGSRFYPRRFPLANTLWSLSSFQSAVELR